MQVFINKSILKKVSRKKFMVSFITGLVLFLLTALIQAAFPINYSHQIVILNYHRVSDSLTNPWDAAETVTTQQFRNQLLFLKEHGFNVMTLDDALNTLQSHKKAIPPNSVVLTFDDGDRSFAENALPILKEFNYPSTEFIIGKYSINNMKDYLSWPEIRELAKDPLITFHSHTFDTHSTIKVKGKTYFETDPIYLVGENRIESNLEYSQRILNDIKKEQDLFNKYLGRNDNVIALPYGHASQAFISLAKSYGYTYFLTQDRSQANRVNVNPTHIFRLDVGNRITDTQRLSLLMKGLTSSGPLHIISWLRVKYNQIRFDFSPHF